MVNINKPPKGIDPLTYNYLYQLSELLGVMLDNGGAGSVGQATVVQQVDGGNAETDYSELKSLIIKTADDVAVSVVSPEVSKLNGEINETNASLEAFKQEASETYVSDFGTALLQFNQSIAADPTQVTQYYSFFQELKTAVDGALGQVNGVASQQAIINAYIKSGIIDVDDNGMPQYGIAIGENIEVSTNENGETVIEKKNFRATYTSKRMSFWEGENEVAYVSSNKLHITNITALKGLEIGVEKWSITTDNGLAFKWIGGV